ncbi:MAG: alpha/beta fold hydrolase [Actinomycetota bacterium]
MMAGSMEPYVDSGYTVWAVTRRRSMPAGYSIAEMARDYAGVIEAELGGRVEVVVGEEFGGMIGLQLAAERPELLDRLALVRVAWRVTDRGRDLEGRFGEALSSGRFAEAGAAMLEEVVPGSRWRWLRRLLGPPIGRWLASRDYHLPDVLVETRAEQDFDGREILPRIHTPVILIAGTDDHVFARNDVEETAQMLPDCTLVQYEGASGLRTVMSRRVPEDVLSFVNPSPDPRAAPPVPSPR